MLIHIPLWRNRSIILYLTGGIVSGLRSAASTSAAAPSVAQKQFGKVRKAIHKIRQLVLKSRYHLGELMTIYDDLNAKIDNMQSNLDDAQARVQQHANDQQAIIDDLRAQLASQSGGLTPAQGQALLTRLDTLNADIQTTADSIPTSDASATNTGGGETPIVP